MQYICCRQRGIASALDYVSAVMLSASGNRPSTLLAVCLGGGGAGGNGNNGGAAGSHIPFNGYIRGYKFGQLQCLMLS